MTITTLNQAGLKFCPMATDRKCSADQCMAWRITAEKYQGYCGMAGKPSQVVLTEEFAGAKMLKELGFGKGGAA